MSYDTIMNEISIIEASQRDIMNKPRPTQDDREQLMKLEGKIEALRITATEAHDQEVARLLGELGIKGPQARRMSSSDPSLRAFVRSGTIQNAAMSSTDDHGGYCIPSPLVAEIVEKNKAVDPIFARSRFFNLEGGNDTLEIPVQSALGVTGWVAEADARTETASPEFSMTPLKCYEAYCNWAATQLFIDSVPDIDRWIVSEIGRQLFATAGTKFATGAGTTEIAGLFTGGYASVLTEDVDGVNEAALRGAFYALPTRYQPDACWVMAPATLSAVAALTATVSTSGTLTPLDLVKYVGDQPMVYGKPVYLCDNAPAIAENAFPIFYGDLGQAYAVGMHTNGVTLLRDPYTNKPYVNFYSTLRVGGTPLNLQAGVLVHNDTA
jgi:HK97 family phage major capsid protein